MAQNAVQIEQNENVLYMMKSGIKFHLPYHIITLYCLARIFILEYAEYKMIN